MFIILDPYTCLGTISPALYILLNHNLNYSLLQKRCILSIYCFKRPYGPGNIRFFVTQEPMTMRWSV